MEVRKVLHFLIWLRFLDRAFQGGDCAGSGWGCHGFAQISVGFVIRAWKQVCVYNLTKRCNFSFFLKVSMVEQDLMSAGKLFHVFGPAMRNARSPNIVLCLLDRIGTSTSPRSADRSVDRRTLTLTDWHSSVIYDGAISWVALKTIRQSLYCILSGMRSQCRSRRSGVDIWRVTGCNSN